MPAKKRRVTFDPEEVRPSCESSPPPLELANYPPVVSQKDIDSSEFSFTPKSILKNPPQEDRPYESLCNFLIDLPPPPSNELLSIDVLQQETVFRPPNRFEQLKEEGNNLPVFETESSDEDSDESDEEFDLPPTTIDDTINEENITAIEYIPKPKIFESSLLLEQNKDERIFFVKDEDIEEIRNEPSFIESKEIPSNDQDLYATTIQVDFANPSVENSQGSDHSANIYESNSDNEEYFGSGDGENESYLAKVDLNSSEDIESEKLSLENPTLRDNNDYIDGSNTIHEADLGLGDSHDESHSDKTALPVNDSAQNHIDFVEFKFAEDKDFPLQNVVVTSENQLINSNESLINNEDRLPEIGLETDTYEDTNIKDVGVVIGEELKSENKTGPHSNSANTLTSDEPLITEPCELTSEHLSPDTEIALITDPFPLSQFVASTNNSSENVSCAVKDSTKEGLKNILVSHSSLETAEQVVALGDQNLAHEESVISNSTLISPPFHDITNRDNTTLFISQSLDLSNSNTKPNQTEPRKIRKYSKKTHRKHSRASRSISKEDHIGNDQILSDIIAIQDQRAAEAQARFKRYLAKMSGKVTAETQNLNYAGEIETLEPHMRDSIKESQILIWIYNMIDEPARVDFEFFLKDGCILCKLMNRVKPGCIPESEITWEGARSKQKNISNFLREAEKYGVPKAKLFFPEDLLHLRHIPRVTRCIYALAKIAQEDTSLGEETPQLGDEPSFLKPTTTKVIVPGHRDTKDITAQLTAAKEEEKAKKTKHSLYK